MQEGRITVKLWPRDTMFAGRRISEEGPYVCKDPDIISVEVDAAELLIHEYRGCNRPYETQAAISIEAALHEYRDALNREELEP